MSYRLAFAGTPDFAVPTLTLLAQNSAYAILGVFTQPDRPAGRGKKLTPSAVKMASDPLGLKVFQPETLTLADLEPLLPLDALIVAAYGQILPVTVLNAPRFGSINIHASLLPRWRGAAPIARAILEGDTTSGIAIMQMEKGLDSGPVFIQTPLPIDAQDTAHALEAKLAALGAHTLNRVLPEIFSGQRQAQIQSTEGVSYAHKLQKNQAKINWEDSALTIDRQVRAFFPYPIAETLFQEKVLRIFQGQAFASPRTLPPPGTVVAIEKSGIGVACGQGLYQIQALQLAGGKRLLAWDFAQGQRVKPFHCFGSTTKPH